MKRYILVALLLVPGVLLASWFITLSTVTAPEPRSLLTASSTAYATGPNMDSIFGGSPLPKVTVAFWYHGVNEGIEFSGFYGATDGSWAIGMFGFHYPGGVLGFCFGAWTHVLTVAAGTGWHHYVAVFDNTGSNLTKLYKDGAEVSTLDSSAVSSITPPAAPFLVGHTHDGYTGASGYFRNFALWDTALTAANVTTLYNGGVAENKALEVVPSNLKLFLPINSADNVEAASGILDTSGNAKNSTGSGMTNGTNLVSTPVI
jgi:hypothetical protein